MKSLSLKTVVVGFIVAIGFLTASPFTLDLTADPYTIDLDITVEECWDTSTDAGSIPTLCSSDVIDATVTMVPSDHIGSHYPDTIDLDITSKKKTTSSCYIGCSSS